VLCRLTIDEADLEPGALAPLAASLQLLPAPDPSSDDDDLLPPLVGRSISDAALTAALIAEQLGDAEVLHATGARSQYTAPVSRDSATSRLLLLHGLWGAHVARSGGLQAGLDQVARRCCGDSCPVGMALAITAAEERSIAALEALPFAVLPDLAPLTSAVEGWA
jgi:hypothetical protein